MKEVLQRSEQLASYLTAYREEAPLLSLKQAEQLVLDHPPGLNRRYQPLTKTLMTLTGLTLSILAYFTFSTSNDAADQLTPDVTRVASIAVQQLINGPKQAEPMIIDTQSIAGSITRSHRANPSELKKNDAQQGLLVSYFELSASELANVGIINEGKVVTYFYRMDPNSIGNIGILRKWGAMLRQRPLPEGVNAPDVRPTFVTDGIGRKRMFTYEKKLDSAASAKLFSEINSLVPIIVREEGDSGPIDSLDLIFWYLPTESIFELLPDSVKVLAEAQARTNSNANSSTVLYAGRTIRSVAVYPNPSPGTVSIQLSMDEPHKIVIVLRDLLGRAVTSTSVHQVGAQSTITLNFDVPDGIYLLEIKPDHGDRIIQRMVIAK